MIRVIFIIIAFLMMAGAILGGLYYWGFDPMAKLGLLPEKHKEPVVVPPPVPIYVDYGLLIVPVVQDRQVKAQAEMIIRLVVDDNKKDKLAHNLPRLQNAFLQDMIAFLGVIVKDGEPLDVEAIRRRLLIVAERTLGERLVKDVLIENPNLH